MGNKLKHIFIVEASDYCKCNIDDLNEQLKAKKDFDYMLYMRSFVGKETDIVKKCCMLFRKENLRFYACGNFEMVEGIIKGLDSFENREVAFCPLGNKKGMLKNFEKNYVNFKIDALINGEVKCIDYVDAGDICMTNYASVGAMSYAINDLNVLNSIETEENKNFFKKAKMFVKIAKNILISMNEKLEITIDDEKREDSYSLAHIANGASLSNKSKDEESLEDGVLEYILVKKCSLLKKLQIIKKMIKGNLTPIDDMVYIGCCKKFSIEEKHGKNVIMSYDGRSEKRSKLEGNVKNKMVRIVVPQPEKI